MIMPTKVTKSKCINKQELIDVNRRIIANRAAEIIPAPKRSHKKKSPVDFNKPVFFRIEEGPVNLVNSISKPATILYKKLPDDMILITGFENFKSIDNILDQYGRLIAITYNNYPSRMSGDVSGIILYGNNGKSSLRIGETCDKAEFSKIIAHVKKCGGLLHDIIQAVNGGEVKRIEI
jgi:hypothetical protein